MNQTPGVDAYDFALKKLYYLVPSHFANLPDLGKPYTVPEIGIEFDTGGAQSEQGHGIHSYNSIRAVDSVIHSRCLTFEVGK
jgi:hypothetical protein